MDLDAHVKKLERFRSRMTLLLKAGGMDLDAPDFEERLADLLIEPTEGIVRRHAAASTEKEAADPLVDQHDTEINDLHEKVELLEQTNQQLLPLMGMLSQMTDMAAWFAGNRERLEALIAGVSPVTIKTGPIEVNTTGTDKPTVLGDQPAGTNQGDLPAGSSGAAAKTDEPAAV